MTKSKSETQPIEPSAKTEELSTEAASLVSSVREALHGEEDDLQRVKNAILGRVLAEGDEESSTNSTEELPPGVAFIRPVQSK